MHAANKRFGWVLLVASCAGLGCATTHVRTDRDPAVNLASYRTFAVQTGQVINEGILDTRDTLVRDRINSALTDQLSQKGLQPDRGRPDLIATYTAGTRTRQELNAYWSGNDFGWYPDPAVGSGWSNEYRRGTLVIDLIDARSKKLVWRSIVQADNKDFRSAQNIEHAVDKALQKYPQPTLPSAG